MASSEQVKSYPLQQPDLTSYTIKDQLPIQPNGKSHAPEPPTMILLMGGVLGMIIRFAQMSFRACKRGMNRVLSLLAIIMTAPLLLLIALLIRVTSKGSVIYRQKRVGKYGHNFMMLKFRTMTVDAEKGVGAVWAKENDPRVTPIGGILRKTHLDELPQFFNVLMGEMNIVGPRPERPEIVKDLRKNIADYDKRLEILPGITGLAQVLHRADESLQDVRRKVKYDLFYIKKMCWLMEIRVLTSTMFVMLTGKTVQFNKVRSSYCLLYTSPSPRDGLLSRMPSSA